ncbi:MAG: UDP-N-acetylmuramoyl-L-alanyl-D-glutamate--2,6-diaminopimelate ligase [Actinobacteria bacterium]|nr:UDP-N-acetylmuramoyl-L-alanyl-D-glutamate--2,6-diaminopimelate ligase [Actinomycetota bacterium]
MKLRDVLKDIGYINIVGPQDIEITGISINSKKTKIGNLFISIMGFKKDGHDFAREAAQSGTSAVMVQKVLELPENITQILVKDCRKEFPKVCRNFYKNPTGSLVLIGVTGTNGKTTTVYLTDSILKSEGLKTSMITTVGSFIGHDLIDFDRTTPESLDLNEFFRKSVREGIKASTMEVSSHSIDIYRIDYLDYDYFIFTNLTQDHLDYHVNMENYFEVKERLFLKENRRKYGGKEAVINIDDIYGAALAGTTDLKSLTYAIRDKSAGLLATDISNSINGTSMYLNYQRRSGGNFKFKISSKLCGFFNVYNILASAGMGLIMDLKIKNIQDGIRKISGVPGRFEKIELKKNRNVIVDYAHTPDGLENVLKTARSLLEPGGKLISVFGCGGDRDKTKRKIMGGISALLADFTIITSDNPRTEEPEMIMDMIEEGFRQSGTQKYMKIADRKEAIFNALDITGKKDIIMIAGKGHEDYQEFSDFRIHFSDQEVVKDWDR